MQELRPVINLFFMCFLITPETLDFRGFRNEQGSQLYFMNFANQIKQVFY